MELETDIIQLQQLYFENPKDKLETLRYFGGSRDDLHFDQLEYYMGMQRGQLFESGMISCLENINKDLHLPFENGIWVLIPTEDILDELNSLFLENYGQPSQDRTSWQEIPALHSPSYSYRLFIQGDTLIKDANNKPCKSGETMVESDLHPCFTLPAAVRFITQQNLSYTRTLDICSGAFATLLDPIPGSFFDKDIPGRPEPRILSPDADEPDADADAGDQKNITNAE